MADSDVEMKEADEQQTRLNNNTAAASSAAAAAAPSSSSSLAAPSFPSAPRNSRAQGDNLPWVEKYRPSGLDELLSHGEIISTVGKLIDSGQLPHLLFYGPPGTGKTSTILAVARKLNGPRFQSMVLELNASDDRGIDVVRDQIRDFASSRQLFSGGIKLIILDEADAMTRTAQFALRRVIEKYTKNARFCILANYVNKIIPALQSRCTKFRFGPLGAEQVKGRLEMIVEKEGVNITPDGLEAIMRLAAGDMRKSLNVLQACHLAYPKVDEEAVYACTGNPLPADMKSVLNILHNEPLKKAFDAIHSLQVEKGLSLIDILTFLHELVLKINYPPPALNFLLAELSSVEHRLSLGANEHVQLAAVVGVFKQVCAKTEQFRIESEKMQQGK